MDELKAAFDTVIVGLLAIPWLLILWDFVKRVIHEEHPVSPLHVLLPNKGEPHESVEVLGPGNRRVLQILLPNKGELKLPDAAYGVLVVAVTYFLGAALFSPAKGMYDERRYFTPLGFPHHCIGLGDDYIKVDTYVKAYYKEHINWLSSPEDTGNPAGEHDEIGEIKFTSKQVPVISWSAEIGLPRLRKIDIMRNLLPRNSVELPVGANTGVRLGQTPGELSFFLVPPPTWAVTFTPKQAPLGYWKDEIDSPGLQKICDEIRKPAATIKVSKNSSMQEQQDQQEQQEQISDVSEMAGLLATLGEDPEIKVDITDEHLRVHELERLNKALQDKIKPRYYTHLAADRELDGARDELKSTRNQIIVLRGAGLNALITFTLCIIYMIAVTFRGEVSGISQKSWSSLLYARSRGIVCICVPCFAVFLWIGLLRQDISRWQPLMEIFLIALTVILCLLHVAVRRDWPQLHDQQASSGALESTTPADDAAENQNDSMPSWKRFRLYFRNSPLLQMLCRARCAPDLVKRFISWLERIRFVDFVKRCIRCLERNHIVSLGSIIGGIFVTIAVLEGLKLSGIDLWRNVTDLFNDNTLDISKIEWGAGLDLIFYAMLIVTVCTYVCLTWKNRQNDRIELNQRHKSYLTIAAIALVVFVFASYGDETSEMSYDKEIVRSYHTHLLEAKREEKVKSGNSK